MEFPATRAKLIAAGWRFTNHAFCVGCKAAIEWWLAPPQGMDGVTVRKRVPLEAITAHSLRSHFESCPNAAEFRAKRKAQREAVKQGELFR
jgi:hypothetical protein